LPLSSALLEMLGKHGLRNGYTFSSSTRKFTCAAFLTKPSVKGLAEAKLAVDDPEK
jgi:hypothetical protein